MLLDWLDYGLLIHKYEILRFAQDDKIALSKGYELPALILRTGQYNGGAFFAGEFRGNFLRAWSRVSRENSWRLRPFAPNSFAFFPLLRYKLR